VGLVVGIAWGYPDFRALQTAIEEVKRVEKRIEFEIRKFCLASFFIFLEIDIISEDFNSLKFANFEDSNSLFDKIGKKGYIITYFGDNMSNLPEGCLSVP